MGIRLCVLTATALSVVALTAPAADAASIRVPLDRDHPGLGKITVRYAVVRHTDRSRPPLEPIVAFEGGPGYGSIGSASTYLFMLGKLHRRHDLIVMDQRGTGSSGAIDCPALQAGIPPYAAAAAACARRLGRTASAYGTGAVADDMAAILRKLHVPKVDVYGDSYGTYAAQVFAVRHPGRTRAVVVDAAFDNSFDPFERESSAALRAAWRAVCARAGRCPGSSGSIRVAGAPARAHPIVGTGTDADGVRRHVRLGPVELGDLVYDATYTYTVFRDLPGALAALRHGDRAPMLRLAAEDVAFNLPGGSPSSYSVGRLPGRGVPRLPHGLGEERPARPAPGDPRERHPAPLPERVRAVLEARLAPHRRRARARAGLPRLAAAAGSARRRSPAAARGRRCRCSS